MKYLISLGGGIVLILLAEDDPKISNLLMHLLRGDGHEVDHAVNGEEALIYSELNDYEVVILDWMMPLLSGVEVCSILRDKGFSNGILMLTARDSLDDKVNGLESGADDYIVKPFEYRELVARLKALARRSEKKIKKDISVKGKYSINRSLQCAFYNGVVIEFSRREYQMFSLLFENAGNAVPRGTIIDRVWGIDGDISDNNLDAFIRLLRKKIALVDEHKVIINVRGIGYKLEV